MIESLAECERERDALNQVLARNGYATDSPAATVDTIIEELDSVRLQLLEAHEKTDQAKEAGRVATECLESRIRKCDELVYQRDEAIRELREARAQAEADRNEFTETLRTVAEQLKEAFHRNTLEVTKALWYDLAKEMNQDWDAGVRHRPEVNIYRAGMDKVLRNLEDRFLGRANAIDAAMARSDGPEDSRCGWDTTLEELVEGIACECDEPDAEGPTDEVMQNEGERQLVGREVHFILIDEAPSLTLEEFEERIASLNADYSPRKDGE